MCGKQRHLCRSNAKARQWDIYSMFFMLCNVTLWLQLKILEKGWNELLWIKVGEACNVKVIWTHAGETFLCDIFDIWQQRGSCKANRSSFSQILPVDSCIFDDQLDTRDCQGRSGPFVTIRQLKPSLALQLLTYHIVYFHHFDDGGFPENQIFSEFFFISLNKVCLFPDNQNS